MPNRRSDSLRLIVNDGAFEDRATVSVMAGRVISGILRSDETVTTAEGRAFIDGNIQVAESVNLSVQPGVRLRPLDGTASIELFGALTLKGSEENQIRVQNITIALRNDGTSSLDATSVELTDVILGPTFFGGGFGSSGPMRIASSSMIGGEIDEIGEGFIRQSRLIDVQPVEISGNPSIENNLFINGSGRLLIEFVSGVGATVNGNTFDVQLGALVIDYDPFTCDESNFLVGPLNAENNFWQTTSSAVIGNMILDSNDDLGRCDPVSFEPFLTSPSPDTPM